MNCVYEMKISEQEARGAPQYHPAATYTSLQNSTADSASAMMMMDAGGGGSVGSFATGTAAAAANDSIKQQSSSCDSGDTLMVSVNCTLHRMS